MGLAFINGFSARCRDCKWFVPDEFHIKDDIHDGTCSNAKHVKTHGGGKGRNSTHLGLPVPEQLKLVPEQLHDRVEKSGEAETVIGEAVGKHEGLDE